MASTVGSRLAFEKAKRGIKQAGFSLGQAVLSQSYLRSELPLSTTKTLYQFPILVNDNSQVSGGNYNTTNLLQLQDAFFVSHLGLYFVKPSSSTDTTFQLVTYPNAQIFSSTNTASSLYSFYNGNLSITVNNRQIVPSLDLYRFYSVPQQQSVANAYYTSSAVAFKDQQDGSSSALYPIEPGIVFSGSKQNIVQIQIPAALAAVETNSRVVLYFAGHLAQNVTSVR
jgi:hypothetical protein